MAISIVTQKRGKKGGGGLGQMLGLVGGAVIGGVAGGPAGALAGASTGASLGGMAGNAIDPAEQAQQLRAPQIDNNRAMQRKAQLVESEGKLKALREAAVSLPEVDPATRAESAAPILQAYKVESQKLRGIG
jgi:hypothetical protein